MDTALGRHIRDTMEAQRRAFLDGISLERLREMWDAVTDDIAIEGGVIYDCDDIHAALNRRGDGEYCAV